MANNALKYDFENPSNIEASKIKFRFNMFGCKCDVDDVVLDVNLCLCPGSVVSRRYHGHREMARVHMASSCETETEQEVERPSFLLNTSPGHLVVSPVLGGLNVTGLLTAFILLWRK